MPSTNEPRIVKIFVTHQWFTMRYPVGTENDYWRILRWLVEAEEWAIVDQSVPPEQGRFNTTSVSKIERFLRDRMASSDVVINASAAVGLQSRDWFRREARLARATNAGVRPVLVVRPKENYYWSEFFTDRADAWATWTRKSVVDGVRSLLGLTADRRSELLKRAEPCTICGKRRARLELNRLRGVYCAACGAVAYRLNGRRLPCWRDWGRCYPTSIRPITKRQADAARRRDDPAALAKAALGVGWFVPTNDWGVRFCAELVSHPHPYVRGSAVRSLFYRAHVVGKLDNKVVKRAARAALRDENRYVRSQAYLLADYLERDRGWRVSA